MAHKKSALKQSEGFGLVEVIVSMVLFAILMAALAPLIIKSVQTTARMTSVATANQLVIDGVDTLRVEVNGSAANCAAVKSTDEGVITSLHEDERGIQLTRTIELSGSCALEDLATIHAKVTATSDSLFFRQGQLLSEASQQIYIGGS